MLPRPADPAREPFRDRAPVSLPANPIVVIPARLASSRLPDKPLADIHGEPMVVHVWRRAVEAAVGPVVVAAGEAAIARAVEAAGGRAVLTRPDHPSGSDRVHEALGLVDPAGRHDVVVNLQGDLPTLQPTLLGAVLDPLEEPAVDIATLAVEIAEPAERHDPNVVKVAAGFAPGGHTARALYFSRAPIPWPGAEDTLPLYHHIGLYAYRRAALTRFATLPRGVLETRERLEQLRALEAGLRIDVALVDMLPVGVNTPADLARARAMLAPSSST
jgi:3-deoxy-manno-octulosonate cytidylyltransferase (CMP-KDO synthetase)